MRKFLLMPALEVCVILLLASFLESCCCGNSDLDTRSSDSNWASVAAGSSHTCGLRKDGTVLCWGCGESESGLGSDHGQCNAPLGSFKSVTVSHFRSCAMGLDDTVSCWGLTESEDPSVETYQLLQDGDWASFAIDQSGMMHHWNCIEGSTVDCSPPARVLDDVSVGMDHACGIDSAGSPTCWGCAMPGINIGQCTPPKALFSEIDSYSSTNCGVRADGNIQCWGRTSGVVSGSFIDVDVGALSSCGIQSDNTLLCWNYRPSVTHEPLEEVHFFQNISVGFGHACGVTMEGQLLCWGENSNGQLDVP